MARKQTGSKVDAFEHKAVGEIPVFYIRDTGKFRAEVYGHDYYADTKTELEAAVMLAIAEYKGLVWSQVILASMDSENSYTPEAAITLKYSRFYWVYRTDGALMRAKWPRDAKADKGMSIAAILAAAEPWSWRRPDVRTIGSTKPAEIPAFKPPCSYIEHYGDMEYYMPYSESVWRGLGRLDAAIKDIRARVIDLLGTPAGHEVLQAASVFLLARPADKESTDGR